MTSEHGNEKCAVKSAALKHSEGLQKAGTRALWPHTQLVL